MRPVLLEMNGFASFREPTTVDFAGADYFALVGPTGAGKSTVIDAMTFALYGSVPRWDNQRTVALALAPTAGRGAVRFVFDVGGQRYVVARELRRAASGGVSVRNARLERLPTRPGSAPSPRRPSHWPTAPRRPPTAVEELLGLPFGDFCTCVVLPQGDFAEFLHAEPRKRQEKLVRILGLGLYDAIARAANSEAAEAKLRAEVLTEQLAGYADATAEAERRRPRASASWTGWPQRVRRGGTEAGGGGRRPAGRRASGAAGARRNSELLRALAVPAGLDQLHERERAASTATRAADRAGRGGRGRPTAPRGPGWPRPPTAAAWSGCGASTPSWPPGRAELPGLAERAEKALADYELAAQDAADAQAGLDRARTAREVAAAALPRRRRRSGGWWPSVPGSTACGCRPGWTSWTTRRAAAGAALRRADAALAAAEAADGRARAELAAAPARPPLEQARRDLRALVELADRRERAAVARAGRRGARRGRARRGGGAIQQRWEHAQARQAGRAARQPGGRPCGRPWWWATTARCARSGCRAAGAAAGRRTWRRRSSGGGGRAGARGRRGTGPSRPSRRGCGPARRWPGWTSRPGGCGRDGRGGRRRGGTGGRWRATALSSALAAGGWRPSRRRGVACSAGRGSTAVGRRSASPADVVVAALGAAVDEVLAGLDRLAERAAAADAAVRAARRDRAVAAGAAAGGARRAGRRHPRAARRARPAGPVRRARGGRRRPCSPAGPRW